MLSAQLFQCLLRAEEHFLHQTGLQHSPCWPSHPLILVWCLAASVGSKELMASIKDRMVENIQGLQSTFFFPFVLLATLGGSHTRPQFTAGWKHLIWTIMWWDPHCPGKPCVYSVEKECPLENNSLWKMLEQNGWNPSCRTGSGLRGTTLQRALQQQRQTKPPI